MPAQTTVIETSRLLLRELEPSDAAALHAVLGDPVSMRYYPAPLSAEQVRAWIERARVSYLRNGYGLWGVVLRASGELIGDTGLILQVVDGVQRVEVGWHIHPEHQRNGYATEAGGACIDFAHTRLMLSEVISLIRPENIPSAGVAKKLGMEIERRTRFADLPHDVWVTRV